MSEINDREKRFLEFLKRLEAVEAEVYKVVKPVIDKHDPEVLLKLGCPEDEYQSTCKIISEAIVREGGSGLTVDELSNLLCFAFHQEFNMWCSPVKSHPRYTEMAEGLLPLLPKNAHL